MILIVNFTSQSCCWKCVPCGTNEISYNPVNGSCYQCPARYWTNDNHTACLPIIPTAVKLSDPAGISVGVVALLGVLGVLSITVVYIRHGNTHIVRASSKVLSYIMLFGIFLNYLTADLILLERTEALCQVVLFSFSIGFCIVVGTLLVKTNRIHRIFSKRAMRKGTLCNFTASFTLISFLLFSSLRFLLFVRFIDQQTDILSCFKIKNNDVHVEQLILRKVNTICSLRCLCGNFQDINKLALKTLIAKQLKLV